MDSPPRSRRVAALTGAARRVSGVILGEALAVALGSFLLLGVLAAVWSAILRHARAEATRLESTLSLEHALEVLQRDRHRGPPRSRGWNRLPELVLTTSCVRLGPFDDSDGALVEHHFRARGPHWCWLRERALGDRVERQTLVEDLEFAVIPEEGRVRRFLPVVWEGRAGGPPVWARGDPAELRDRVVLAVWWYPEDLGSPRAGRVLGRLGASIQVEAPPVGWNAAVGVMELVPRPFTIVVGKAGIESWPIDISP